MVMKPQRPSLFTRWLRHCPQCGAWFALHKGAANESIAGVKNEYSCEKCDAVIKDWKLSSNVKT